MLAVFLQGCSTSEFNSQVVHIRGPISDLQDSLKTDFFSTGNTFPKKLHSKISNSFPSKHAVFFFTSV